MVLVGNSHSTPLDRSFSHQTHHHHHHRDDDQYDQYVHHRFAYGESMSPPQPFSMEWNNPNEQDKYNSGSTSWPAAMQTGSSMMYAGSDLGESSVPQSSNGSGSVSGMYMTGWDVASVDGGSQHGSLTESHAAPASLTGSFAGSVDGSSPSYSRAHRPSQLNLDQSNHLHQPISLPMLASQLALQTPGGVSPTAPELMSATTSRSRHSAGSEFGYTPSTPLSGSLSAAYLSARPPTSDPRLVSQRPYQSLPLQQQQQQQPQAPALRYVIGQQVAGGQWSDAYSNNAQIPVAMTPSSQTYQQFDARYPRGSVDVPPWGYQNMGMQQASVQVSPPTVPGNGVGIYPSGPQSGELYYPQPAPPAFFLSVPPLASPSPLSRTSTPASTSRSKGRKKVVIGRVRLPGAGSRSTSPAVALGQPENPWERMQQSSSLSGAFTHSGVYGLESSDGRVPFWAGQQPVTPRPAEMYGMSAPNENTTMLAKRGYYGPDTAELYQRGSVSIPATVATTHMSLPNAPVVPPAMVMNPSFGIDETRKTSLTAGTPASMCNSTFSSMDEDVETGLPVEAQYPPATASGSSRKPSNVNMHSRAPPQQPQLDQTSEEDEHEELQDIRNVYPGLSDAERSAYDGKATSAEEHSGQSNPTGSTKKKTLRRITNTPADPVNMMDFSRYAARSPRLKLAIACQGCRDKKLKCSGERPMCMNCKRRGLDCCEYAETIRRRGPGRKKLAAIEKKAKNQSRRGLGEDDDESRREYTFDDYDYEG